MALTQHHLAYLNSSTRITGTEKPLIMARQVRIRDLQQIPDLSRLGHEGKFYIEIQD
jgi:hypothetical protein